jgi:hypothetical protein
MSEILLILGAVLFVAALFLFCLCSILARADVDTAHPRERIDSIRAELEAQEAPKRPHIRSVS